MKKPYAFMRFIQSCVGKIHDWLASAPLAGSKAGTYSLYRGIYKSNRGGKKFKSRLNSKQKFFSHK